MHDYIYYLKISELLKKAVSDPILTVDDILFIDILKYRGYNYIVIHDNHIYVSINELNISTFIGNFNPVLYTILVDDTTVNIPYDLLSDMLLFYIKYLNRNNSVTRPCVISLNE